MAQDEGKRVLLYHTRKSDKTIADFVKSQKIIGVKAKDIFDENRDFIFQQIRGNASFLKAYKDENGSVPTSGSDLVESMTLPLPCEIKVCPYNITAETMVNNTNWHTPNNDFYAFASEEIQRIFEAFSYSSEIDKSNCDVEVIGWFKQGNLFGERKKHVSDVRGAWFDLSPYVTSLNASVNGNGGSFSVRLPIIGMVGIVEGFAELPDFGGRMKSRTPVSTLWSFGDKNKNFYAKKSLETAQLGNLFSSLISYNDLIFLSFSRNTDIEAESLGERVAANSWDIIGLVDDVQVNLNGSAGSGYVEITGRDLMKLLIEDGSYFFNPSSSYSAESIYANEAEASANGGVYRVRGDAADVTDLGDGGRGLIKRLRNMSNEIDIFAYRPMREIIYILKGVVSQLSNIEVVPGQIFDFWENRTVWKDITLEEEKNNG